VLIIATVDLASFHRLFIEDRIYDTVAYSLLASRRVFPTDRTQNARVAFTPDDYVAWSLAYYRARDFSAAIQMAQRALALRPGYAEAYNNIGAAYCELSRWREAVEALETAVRLQPGSELARNNLAWARAGLERSSR
jgi:Flp pilus assembly protein TadD